MLYICKKYIQKCFEGTLLNNNSKIFSSKPKISAIIPAYNCENTIKAAVRSIQNQNMSEIEIVLVNDNSKDNTFKIIQELSEEDPRIKILNNEKHMATLYSRNIGILYSKGKYIMNLDNDDLFMNIDLFDIVYKEAETGNFDLIGFSAIQSKTYYPLLIQMKEAQFHDHKNGLMIYQPELTYFAISKNGNYSLNDLHVWGRLTKTHLYKYVINNFGINAIGENRNSCFVTWGEDSAMSMAIYKSANSYKFIKKYGIFHFLGKTTSTYVSKNELKQYGELFFLDAIFDFSHNTINGKRYSVQKIKKDIFKESYILYNEKNTKYLKAIIQKLLNSQYISLEDKKDIKEKLNNLFLVKKY